MAYIRPGKLLLFFVFIFCFILPLYLVSLVSKNEIGGWFERLIGVVSVENSISEVFAVPHTATISKRGQYLSIPGSPMLDLEAEKDSLLVAWFNLSKLPRKGQRMVLFSKYGTLSNSAGPFGYALALAREGSRVRFSVYWGSSGITPKWYPFPEITFFPKTWFALALSLHKDRYLGLHIINSPESAQPGVKLLGGYDLGAGASQGLGEGDFIFGAYEERLFSGLIGPLSFVKKKKLYKEMKKLFHQAAKNPGGFRTFVGDTDLYLQVESGAVDKSRYANKVILVPG